MSARRPLTRGPLPPEVYWRRRFFVITLALTLVFVIGSVLSGGSDGDDDPAAQQAAVAEPTRTVTVTPTAAGERREGRRGRRPGGGGTTPRAVETTPLAEPDGPCESADVAVTPVVDEGVAGQDVTIGLSLQSAESEACTWRVTKKTAMVKILDGSTEVWSSRECPADIPNESVVVRRAVATVVEMTWTEARESDPECSNQRGWAMAGDYTVLASTIGGEPAESTFDLVAPTARTVTVEPKPSRAADPTTSADPPPSSSTTEADDAATQRKQRRPRGRVGATDEPRR